MNGRDSYYQYHSISVVLRTTTENWILQKRQGRGLELQISQASDFAALCLPSCKALLLHSLGTLNAGNTLLISSSCEALLLHSQGTLNAKTTLDVSSSFAASLHSQAREEWEDAAYLFLFRRSVPHLCRLKFQNSPAIVCQPGK
ncbi:hypothetical protein AAC387_Pa11g1024 [Persea americana]